MFTIIPQPLFPNINFKQTVGNTFGVSAYVIWQLFVQLVSLDKLNKKIFIKKNQAIIVTNQSIA